MENGAPLQVDEDMTGRFRGAVESFDPLATVERVEARATFGAAGHQGTVTRDRQDIDGADMPRVPRTLAPVASSHRETVPSSVPLTRRRSSPAFAAVRRNLKELDRHIRCTVAAMSRGLIEVSLSTIASRRPS